MNNNKDVLSRDDLLEIYLLENNLVNSDALHAAKLEQGITKKELGEILVYNGFIKTKTLVDALLSVTSQNLVNEERIVAGISPELIYQFKFMIHAETTESVYISTLSSENELLYHLEPVFPKQEIIFIEANPVRIDSYIATIQTIYDSESSKLELVARDAITAGASDIHIVLRHTSYTVLYRLDGVLSIQMEGETDEFRSLSARIKDRSKMDMAENRKPQDGAFDIAFNGRIVGLRVSTVPIYGGESIVIRILDPEKSNVELDKLGITEIEQWRKGCSRLEGLNLVCGMTGSGKTTTLTSTLREADRFGKAIFTAEDPVENPIPYVRQVNLNENVGLDFSRSLKSFMRSDPDIMMIGEIRDDVAARNTIKAAETGHLVMSTLHTSSILGAVGRMRDLNVPFHELKTVLRSVLAQNLMRKLCLLCKNDGSKCRNCRGTGYKGLTIISECHYFKNEEEVERIFTSRKPEWKSIMEDAFEKFENGVTDEKELIRIFGPEVDDMLKAHKNKINNNDKVDI